MTSPKAVRTLIVGCGAVASELYAHSLQRLGKRSAARVVGLVDPDPERLEAMRRHFPAASCHQDLEAALESVNASFAVIASPPALHCSQAISILRRGLHVLCEKPMAVTRAECEAMLDAASAAQRRIFVGLPRRLYPVLQDIQVVIASGALGNRLRFTYHEGGRYNWPVATPGALRRSSSGGGVLMDKGSHALDFLVRAFGEPLDIKYSDDAFNGAIETNCVMSWEGSALDGTVTLSWDQDLANALNVLGERGELRWDISCMDRYVLRMRNQPERILVSTTKWASEVGDPSPEITPRNYFECIALQLVQTLRALASGEPSPLDATTAAVSVGLIEQCYDAATALPQPWLTMEEQAETASRHWARAI